MGTHFGHPYKKFEPPISLPVEKEQQDRSNRLARNPVTDRDRERERGYSPIYLHILMFLLHFCRTYSYIYIVIVHIVKNYLHDLVLLVNCLKNHANFHI